MAIELYSVNEVGEDVYLEFMVDRKTANQILSGFLLRAITDAVKDIDPERPKPPKEGAIQRLEDYIRNPAVTGATAKAYALGMAEVVLELGGPDYADEIEHRFGDVK